MASRCGLVGRLGVLAFLLATPAGAQAVSCVGSAGVSVGIDETSGSVSKDPNCSNLFRCYPPVLGGASYQTLPGGCNPKAQPCSVRATVSVEFPGHAEDPNAIGSGANLQWKNAASAVVGFCGALGSEIFFEQGSAWIQIGGFQCGVGAPLAGAYTLQAEVCIGASCLPPVPQSQRRSTTGIDLSVPQLEAVLCKKPPASGCPGESPVGACCLGPAGGTSPGGGGAGTGGPGTGPGAYLYHLAGSVGHPDYPGAAVWQPTLGRYWSHTWAERIVPDPSDAHVWLISRYGTYAEFSGLSGGVYATTGPSDDTRKLHRTATGWELRSLDGTVRTFDSAGRFSRLTDRNGNATVADYSAGPLTRVTLPDGRREDFFYHPSGKLAEIRQVGVDGTTGRSWFYTWSGNDLVRIDRPDGTALEFLYGDPRFPGYMTRRDLVGTDLARRIEAAWEYDAFGNVAKTWRGDPVSNGPNAVDLHAFTYTNPLLPSKTAMTDPLGKVTTYTLARDSRSNKPKVTQIEGDCPVCGTGPNERRTYDDAAHPLRPTRVFDGRGIETQFSYNAQGMMVSKTEAVGTPLARTTAWEYGNTSYPAFPTKHQMPSTSGGAALRVTTASYNTAGDAVTRTEQGAEAGSSFSFSTATAFNAAGQPLTIDPPGHAAADATSFTYDSTRGSLVALTRTDPLVGTTTFGYDAFNRRTSVTDPNAVETVTAYDAADRVTSVTQKGAVPAENLVTVYEYNGFRDLFRVTHPRGNVIEYTYDAAGRLLSIEQKPNASTPGERTLFTLDGVGHRVREDLQRWSGSAWVSESWTESVYSSRCHLDKVIHPGGAVTEYAYDCAGNLERVWDANHPRATNPNPTQLYAYDSLNRISSVTQPWTGAGGSTAVTSYGYDVQDHLTQVTDAEGNATLYTYSDRDLMTRQDSPVSGLTTYSYDEHGELQTEIDARGIVTTRTVDAADRPTQQTFGPPGTPDSALTITYAYGSTPAQFNAGRLTGITRNGQTIAYTYDRFGRVLQDGSLTYGYDKNGNRSTVTYPGGVSALYTHDFADREATLSYDAGSGPQPLVTSAGYKPLGPLSTLTFANGLSETRLFDARYFPDRIQAGTLLDWDYTEDAVGNPTQITGTIAGQPYTAAFSYQDPQYFLTQGNGPWGTRSWTYDRIGNRLTHQESGEPPQTYTYAGTGHNPKLLQITPAPGLGTGVRQYAYDAAGNQISVQETDEEGAVEKTFLDASPENHLSALRPTTAPGRTDMLYDGRGYLRQAHLTFTGSQEDVKLTPTYSSEGLLMSRAEDRHWSGGTPGPDGEDSIWLVHNDETTHLFYFAGRPVAQLTDGALFSITTDHLGTPILITNHTGTPVWAGGLEPFGRPWTAGGNPDPEPLTASSQNDKGLSRLSSESAFLRYPGQWASDAFRVGGVRMEVYYNVHRWYEVGVGRYGQVDPISLGVLGNAWRPPEIPVDAQEAHSLTMFRIGNPEHEQPYHYAIQNPLLFTDAVGLFDPGTMAGVGGMCIAADGPVPIGDIIGVPLIIGAGIWALSEIITEGLENVDDCEECKTRDICHRLLVLCLDNPSQPEWNRRRFGSRKDCGACFRRCVNNGGEWPFDKCPLP